MSPDSAESWGQRAGRGACALGVKCTCIVMVTKHMVEDACKMCKNAGIAIDQQLAEIRAKAEDQAEEEVEAGADNQVEDRMTPATIVTATNKPKPKTGQHQMTLAMAEYIATATCCTEVLDQEYNNPPHESCYSVGGCNLCIKARQIAEDIHHERRQAIKEEEEDLVIEDEDAEPRRKKPATRSASTGARTGQERVCFAEGLATIA